jgi:glycosyltransferase involved in cell wall biosynthesis
MKAGNLMRLLFALPGFHRVDRGAEIALLSVANGLAELGEQVTVIGSGEPRPQASYQYLQARSVPRERFERFPKVPPFRNETAWEDATFAATLLARYSPDEFDATITCAFPFTHLALRRPSVHRPAHVFVTQNGDWPAREQRSEFRFFDCDGLVCTNPDYFDANRERWTCALIPNGVDLERFSPGEGDRAAFGLPENMPIVLMVSALIQSKRVMDGIRAVAAIEGVFLVVAGDGPLRRDVQQFADQLLPNRFKRLSVPAEKMPLLYCSADVFLHLSLLESFGNVFLEAWASGLPIVAQESSRLRWILGSEHFLCNTTVSLELVQQLRNALDCESDEVREGVRRFAWASVASEYQDFIRKLV